MKQLISIIFLFCCMTAKSSTNIISWNLPNSGFHETYTDSKNFNVEDGDVISCRCSGSLSNGSYLQLYLTIDGEKLQIFDYSTPNLSFDKTVTYQFIDEGTYTLSYVYYRFGGGTAYSANIIANLNDRVLSTSLTLDTTSIMLNIGEKHQLKPIIVPEYASNKTIAWTSSDEDVALVSAEGLITSIKSGSATITAQSTDGTNLSASCIVTVKDLKERHDYVDLGLPSGTLWATCNIGANAPEEQGYNYAWGELYPSSNFSNFGSKNYTLDKYNSRDNLTELEPEDDVAYQTWGKDWKIPSKDDFQELIDNCKFSFDYMSAPTSPNGYVIVKLTAKNGNYILLPQSDILAHNGGDIDITYWTSTINSEPGVIYDAYQTAYSYYAQTTTNQNVLWCPPRWISMPIRPVTKLIMIQDLSITPELNLAVGDKSQIKMTTTPQNASNNTLEWTSSDESIAIVDSNGVVEAIKIGTTTIKATTTDGSNLSASCVVTVNPILATSISLDKTSEEIYVGESLTLSATIAPTNATNQNLEWSSSDNTIANVDNGIVTALKPGTVTITVKTTDGSNISATCKITVKSNVATSISLNTTSTEIPVGRTYQLIPTILPTDVTNKSVNWKTSDATVATVDDSGLVTAHKLGSVTIMATTTDGTNLSASCKVTVIPVYATSISLNKTSANLQIGETTKLTATVQPQDVSNGSVVWSSSDNAIATVNNGVVTAIKPGIATITAKTADGTNLSAYCSIIVNAVSITSISLNTTSAELVIGESISLAAKIQPSNATYQNIEWSSSNSNVATVDNGVVKTVSPGTAIITARTMDGSNLSAICTIKVMPIYVSSVTLNMESIDLMVEETSPIHVTIYPTNATDKTIIWTSSNGNVAIVEDGVIRAIGEGTATITAKTIDGSNLSASCVVNVSRHPQTISWTQDFSALKYGGELIELTASASSGLPISYKSSDDDVAIVFDWGYVAYLNPNNIGTAKITALQSGNDYYVPIQMTKDVCVVNPNGITNIPANNGKYTIYTINGVKVGAYTLDEYNELVKNHRISSGIYIINGIKSIIKL